MMEEIPIVNIEHLRAELDKCGTGEWVFRGQSDSSWLLEPSINRLRTRLTTINNFSCPLKGKEKLDWAEKMRRLEIEMFSVLLNSHTAKEALGRSKNILEGLVHLQHYGAPTRLLDYTYLPYVALFFAASEGERDFALYAAETSAFDEFSENATQDYDFLWDEEGANSPEVYIYRPAFSNERIEMQRGLFLLPSTTVLSFEGIIERNSRGMKKYVIPGSLRREVIVIINQMGIGPRSVYPELEGVVKNFAWETSVKALS